MTQPGPYRFRGHTPPTASSRASILEPDTTGDGAVSLYLYDPIDSYGGYWGVSAKEFGEALDALPEDISEIRLYINSPGGEVWDAMAIVNQLRRHPARVVAIVDGIAASAASVIAVTADETVMGVGSQMMIHDAWNIAIGDEADMLSMADRLGKSSDALAQIYAQKAGGAVEEWRDVMRAETWFYGAEAVAAGLADRAEGGEPASDDARAQVFDLSIFKHPGRGSAPKPPVKVARVLQRSKDAAAALVAAPGGHPPIGVATDVTPQTPVSSEPGNTIRKETPVDHAEFLTGLRARLGVTDATADEATILAALDESLQETTEPTAPEGTVLLDQAAFDELRVQAAEGAQARTVQITKDRDAIVDAAVADGRIAPANRDVWRARLDENESGTAALLATLTPSKVVPVTPVGYTGGEEDNTEDAAYNKLYPTQKEA